MEWTKLSPGNDSSIAPTDRLDFDTIRAIVSMRQANCLTVKTVCDLQMSQPGEHAAAPQSPIDLINGRQAGGNAHNLGMFANAQSTAMTQNEVRIK